MLLIETVVNAVNCYTFILSCYTHVRCVIHIHVQFRLWCNGILQSDWSDGSGPPVGANTFQAMVACALYDELLIHTGLIHSTGYAVAGGYLVTVAKL